MDKLQRAGPTTETGEDFLNCAIITMPANKLLAEMHNAKQRMPLILPPEAGAVETWLTRVSSPAPDTADIRLSRRHTR